jgi:preprotein translocase subunit SecD
MTTTRAGVLLLLLTAACGRGAPTTGPAIAAPAPPPATGPRPALRLTYELDGDVAVAQRTAEVMTRRFEVLGIAGVTARADGAHVIVEVPDLSDEDLERVRGVATRRGHLTVHAVDHDAAAMQAIVAHAARDAAAARAGIRMSSDAWRDPAGNHVLDVYLTADDREEEMPIEEAKRLGCWRGEPPALGSQVRCRVTGRQAIEGYLARLAASDPALAVADDRMIRFERVPPVGWRSFHLERAAALDGGSITRASPGQGGAGSELLIDFDRAGARALEDLTAAHVGDKVAIVLDERVVTAPIVLEPTPGGRMALALGPDPEGSRDAEELAIVLAGGALPTAVVWLTAERLGDQE